MNTSTMSLEKHKKSLEEYQQFLDDASSLPMNHKFGQRPCVEAHFRPTPGCRLLDIGSYTGANLVRYAPIAGELVGVEAAQPYVDTCYGYLAQLPEELQGRVHVICELIENLTFESDFDYVLCVDVLLHVLDPVAVMCKIHEALKPGTGEAFVSVSIKRFRTHSRDPSMAALLAWCHEAGLHVDRSFTDMKQHIVIARRAR